MQRTTLTILLAGSLLAAGLLTAAATDLAPGNPLTSSTTTQDTDAAAAAATIECVAADDTAFPEEATVESFTGDASDATRMKLDLTAWQGGIQVTTWAQDTWQVEVAEVDDQDRLEPQVEGRVDGSVLHLAATVEDTGEVEHEWFSMSASVNGEPRALLKVHVPDLQAEEVRLQDAPDRNGMHIYVNEVEPDDLTPPWNGSDDEGAFPMLVAGLDGGSLHVDADNTDVVLADASFDTLKVETDNGHVTASATTASAADLTTDNGNVCLTSARLDDVRLETDNGNVMLEGPEVTHLSAHTDSGNIAGSVVPVASGTVQAEADHGDVDLQVPTGPVYGYEANAQTDHGEIEVNLPGATITSEGEASGPQHAYALTNGFDSRDVRVTVTLVTDSGDILLGST